MLTIVYPFLIALLGLLLWGFAANAKAQDAGKILFFCGAFFLTAKLAAETFHL